MKKINNVFCFVLLAAVTVVAAGCGRGSTCSSDTCIAGPSTDGIGSVSFALSPSDMAATRFIVRLFKGPEKFAKNSVYFTSPCSRASSGFTIDQLDEGDDYVIEYLAYASDTCSPSSLVGRGVRGGVRISALGTGDGYYYVQVNKLGAFNSLPVPDSALNPVTGGVACETDSDCRRVIPCESRKACRFPVTVDCDDAEILAGDCPDGTKLMQYNVHPKAVCDGTVCRLETLFPLNTRGDRAFAASVSTGTGDVVTVGGFSAVSDSAFTVQGASDTDFAPETQIFGGDSAIFGVLEHDRPLDAGLGMSGAAMIDSTRMMVVGGTQKATAVSSTEGVFSPITEVSGCSGSCGVALSPYVYVIDYTTGDVSKGTLPSALIPAFVVPVARRAAAVYIRAGITMGESGTDVASVPSRLSLVCEASSSGAVACADVSPSKAVARRSPAGVCTTWANGKCNKFLVLGGTSDKNSFGELYFAADDYVQILKAVGDVPDALYGAVAFQAGDSLWTIGGTTDAIGSMAVPYKITVNESEGTVEFAAVNLTANEIGVLSRTFHQATVLMDGETIVVTGGMGPTGSLFRNGVLLSAAGGTLAMVDNALRMTTPRIGHSANLVTGGLSDGAVLVTGGISSEEKWAAGAELYVPAE